MGIPEGWTSVDTFYDEDQETVGKVARSLLGDCGFPLVADLVDLVDLGHGQGGWADLDSLQGLSGREVLEKLISEILRRSDAVRGGWLEEGG